MSNPLACHTHAWDYHWEKAMNEIAEIGFSGIEYLPTFYEKYIPKTEVAKRVLGEHRLSLSAMYCECDYCIEEKREEIFQNVLPMAEFLYALGSRILVVDNSRRGMVENIRKDFSMAAETLTELGKRCRDYDVLLCIHTHHNHRIMKEEEIDRLMNLVDTRDVFLCPDTGQLQRGGDNPAEIIQTYGECIRHVIISDLSPDHDIGDIPFPALGQGGVDFPDIHERVKEIEYTGWLTLFFEPGEQEAKESARKSLEYWNQLI